MNKYTLLLLIFFSFFLSYNYLWNYFNYHSFFIKEKELISDINSFSLGDVEDLTWLSIFSTPDLDLLDDIVYEIDTAKHRVYLEVYILTEKKIQKALKRAYDRWLDVRVILEKNVYLAPSLNNKSYNNLKDYWINVIWSNSDNYLLNHSKMFIIDNLWIIGTWNMSYSTFKYNREFFVFIKNDKLLLNLLDIFINDFNWFKKNIIFDELILSPFSSRLKLESLINSANNSIKIYSQNFSDTNIIDILKNKSEWWVGIDVIMPSIEKIKSNLDTYNDLKKSWINVFSLQKPYIHAKIILVDNKYLYIWSINFSKPSIDSNREIWLIIINKTIIEKILSIFDADKLSINY